MVRTQIQLREGQVAYLKRAAAEQDVSMAEVIRSGIDAMMRESKGVSRDVIKKRALAAVGKFNSGLRNASVRHDEIFAEACKS